MAAILLLSECTCIGVLLLCFHLFIKYYHHSGTSEVAQVKEGRATEKKPYNGISIAPEDLRSYLSIESACTQQLRGRNGTKRLLITEGKTHCPLKLYVRMTEGRTWYVLNITPTMYKQAVQSYYQSDDDKEDDDQSERKRKVCMRRCRQSDVIDDILTLAAVPGEYSLVSQLQIQPMQNFGLHVRLRRRALMKEIGASDSI